MALEVIKQIHTGTSLYDIDAAYLGGHTFDDIQSMVHGVIDTYVIPMSKNTEVGYNDIVNSSSPTVPTNVSTLNGLVRPSNLSETYKIGDIILMEETSESDGTKVFDRWVSNVNGDIVTLSILETKVGTHHHTIDISSSSESAMTGVEESTSTTNTVAKVGTPVDNVLIGESSNYITSVSYGEGSDTLSLSSASGSGSVSHSHTLNSHDHTVKFTPTSIVSRHINAYTTLSTSSYTPHTHSTVLVAGSVKSANSITFVTDGSYDTFVQTLKYTDVRTGSESLSTIPMTSDSNTVGSDVNTLTSGSHTHTVSTETNVNVVTDVNLAAKVITSVSLSHTYPSVAGTVVTDVSKSSDTNKVLTSVSPSLTDDNFLKGCSLSVDNSGILTLVTSSSKAITSVGINVSSKNITVVTDVSYSTASQSKGSSLIVVASALQTYTSGKVTSTGSAQSSGSHTHGFSHTHAIAGHDHTYKKAEVSSSASAYVSLNTSSFASHTHHSSSVYAAASASNGDVITYVYGGVSHSVVRDLKKDDFDCVVGSTPLTTDTKYISLNGSISFPTLTVTSKHISTTTVTPAEDSNEYALTGIKFNSDDFIKTVSSGVINTSKNLGGE